MRLSPTETWTLILAAVLTIIAFRGIVSIIDEARQERRNEQEARRTRRLALRRNINWLIVELTERNDPGLDRALQDSIVEYRVLS